MSSSVRRVRRGVLTVCFIAAAVSSARAQARTWVSGVGDDVNPCSRTLPCKTFTGAFLKTAAGGEIDAIDPGSYGVITINKPITIDGGEANGNTVMVNGTAIATVRDSFASGGAAGFGAITAGGAIRPMGPLPPRA